MRPDLMPILYRGFPYHRRGEQPAHQPDITPYDMPVFSNVDGRVSVFMVREIFGVALRDLGRTMTPEEVEAVDLFRDMSRKVQLEARLEPGEAVFLNNYTVMHARSEFEDWDEPGQKRLMLRLWLDCERKVRPHVRELHVYENEGGRSGIDPVPGRLPAQPKYRMNEQKLLVEQAFQAAAVISARMASAAARLSGDAMIGRDTTRWLAPLRMASPGDTTRFWSSGTAPAGRIPGVTTKRSAPTARRTEAASAAEHTTPPMPEARAWPARRNASAAGS